MKKLFKYSIILSSCTVCRGIVQAKSRQRCYEEY